METPPRSRAPVLAAFGEGAVVGWVEDSSQNGERGSSTLMLARLDSGASPVAGAVSSLALDGSVEGLGLECSDVCQVAATIATGQGGSLQAFEWRGTNDIHVTKLVTLRAQPRGELGPVVVGGDVYYADQGARSDMVIRRVGVEWH